ncbi:50S ribosomal protein L29 [Candidatus Uhrbacteria bacterium]|nr:50S ribosomal protein L29 [Candidatus Uhrbacteria bacterium]
MDISTLRSKTREELERLLAEQRLQLEELRFRASARELKNIHELRAVRRTIARILTVLHSPAAKSSSGAARTPRALAA